MAEFHLPLGPVQLQRDQSSRVVVMIVQVALGLLQVAAGPHRLGALALEPAPPALVSLTVTVLLPLLRVVPVNSLLLPALKPLLANVLPRLSASV